ncbi:DUF2358 domain-containing protein [Synechococcus elongatus]|uniref:DUF2358 domain-containing protein n=1 Tax=Synechococcus elongatus PCC 11802 TaxID=2283154 RepID=A0AAT9JST1_SYNEL
MAIALNDLLETLRQDYARFPKDQSFEVYDPDVFFQDPLTRFQGRDRYQKMIAFIDRWFLDPQLTLHDIHPTETGLESRWTLSWTSPWPWRPRSQISGRTLFELTAEGTIRSHRDYWDCSPWAVLRQQLPRRRTKNPR